MFFLTKRIAATQCTPGERCMTLADWSSVPAGGRGTVLELYEGGIMINWDDVDINDGFSDDDLQYLVFATKKHPNVDPTVYNEKNSE